MKSLFKTAYCLCLLLLLFVPLHAQKKTFTREYTYQASELDSKVTARTNATTQMRNILLREMGEYLHTERTLSQNAASQDYAEKVEAITAGIVEMKTLDEQWNGDTFYIKAEMTVDPKDLERRIADVLNDKQKTKELEEARKRTLTAEAEAARLRKELQETKNEQQRLALQKNYQQATDVLSAEEYFTKGNNAAESGFNELGIEYYQKAIAINPNLVAAYYNMGITYADLENYWEAIRCYQKAVAIDPNFAMAYYNMGNTYKNLKNYNEAIHCYQKALAIDPNGAVAYNNMGNTYRNLENYNEAIRCFQKAIDLDSKYAVAYSNMGIAYANLKNYREAIRCYQKAVAIDPNFVMAYYNMGIAHRKLKNYHKAIRYYKKAVAIDPNFAMAYYNMGNVYDDLGNYNEALRCFQKAARLGDENAQELLQENGYSW
jgi:superkiller protein 3